MKKSIMVAMELFRNGQKHHWLQSRPQKFTPVKKSSVKAGASVWLASAQITSLSSWSDKLSAQSSNEHYFIYSH